MKAHLKPARELPNSAYDQATQSVEEGVVSQHAQEYMHFIKHSTRGAVAGRLNQFFSLESPGEVSESSN